MKEQFSNKNVENKCKVVFDKGNLDLSQSQETKKGDLNQVFSRAIRFYSGLENKHLEITLDKSIIGNKGLLELTLVKEMSLLARKGQNNLPDSLERSVLEEVAAQTSAVDLHFRQFTTEQKSDTIREILKNKEMQNENFAEILYQSLPKKEQDLVLKSLDQDLTIKPKIDKLTGLISYSSYDELSENIISYLKTDASLPEDQKKYLNKKYSFNDLLEPWQKNVDGLKTSPLELVEFIKDVVPSGVNDVKKRLEQGFKPDETLINPHRSYHLEEAIILREEVRLGQHIQKLEGRLKAGNKEVVEELVGLREEFGRAMDLKEKFTELGWPARHNHTNFNWDDGSLSPQQLVDEAINRGITTLYVTGHNSMDGSLKAIEYCKQKGNVVNILPGTEIESPFENEKGQPFGYMHWQIIGPKDPKSIEKMKALNQEVNDRLEAALSLRFEKILDLTKTEVFDSKVTDAVIEKMKNKTAIKESKYFDLSKDSNEEIKQKLLTLFNDVKDYIQKNPREKFLGRFLNKKNLLGKWTNKVWEKDASDKRRCLRALVDSIYKDEDIEKELIAQGKQVPMRTEEAVRRFSEIGCRVSAAHPGLEISDKDVNEEDFLKRSISMVNNGFLNGAYIEYVKYTRQDSERVKRITNEIRQETKKEFRDEKNNSDYHTSKESDIILGLEEDSGGSNYWTLLDNEPDRRSHLEDGKFLIKPYLMKASEQIAKREYVVAMDTLNTALITDPYNKDAQEMIKKTYLLVGLNNIEYRPMRKEQARQKEQIIGLNDEQAISFITDYLKDIKKEGPKVVALVGGPGSGKSIFARKVAANFEKTTVITSEYYLKGDRKWRLDNIENVGKSPLEKYNAEFFNKQIRQMLQLQNGQKMKIPVYEPLLGVGIGPNPEDNPDDLNFPKPEEVDGKRNFIIVEGDFQFLDRSLIDRLIYIDVEDETRFENRLHRDTKGRQFDPDQKANVEKIQANIKLRQATQFYPYTLPWKEKADLLLKVHTTPLQTPDWRYYSYSYDVVPQQSK